MSQAICPTCQQAGKPVEILTLKALLAVPLTELRAAAYHFCLTRDCSTVYFSADGSQSFGEAQLRERVYQKHPDDPDVFVCYCFRHTIQSIKQEPKAVVEAVTQGIKASLCACDIRNPQGSCCLGNVRQESVRDTSRHFRSRRTCHRIHLGNRDGELHVEVVTGSQRKGSTFA